MRWIVAASFCLLGACHRQPQSYVLVHQGNTQVITPPSSKPEFKHARQHPSQKKGCDIESDSFSLTWHGNTARIAVKAETYYAPPPASTPNSGSRPSAPPAITIAESGPRIYVDSVAQLDKFREALEAKEDAGCIRGDEGPRLREAIAEAFPFPPGIAVYLRFGAYSRTSFFDLTTEFRVRIVTSPGANPEISLYAVTRAPGEDRMRIKLVSGSGRSLAIPDTPAYYRYLYRTSGADHRFLATILGAPDRQTLRDATSQFLADPDLLCAKPPAGVFCQSMNAGVNAGFYVKINGNDGFVRLGGTLGEALTDTESGLHVIGQRRTLPAIQSVRRMFHGKLIPIHFEGTDILSLVMMPGDEVTY